MKCYILFIQFHHERAQSTGFGDSVGNANWKVQSFQCHSSHHNEPKTSVGVLDTVTTDNACHRVATAQGKQGKQGIWFLLFPDRENTGNFALAQGKILKHRENVFL